MKNALILPLRFFLGLLLCLAVSALIFGSVYLADLSRGANLISRIIRSVVSSFPFLCLITLFLTSFQPARRKGNMPLSFILLFACAFSCLSFGTWGLDALAVKSAQKASNPVPRNYQGGRIGRQKNGAYYSALSPEKSAPLSQAVVADFTSPGPSGILSFHRRLDLPAMEDAASRTMPGILAEFLEDGMSTAALSRPSGGLLSRIFIALALAFFFTSLWIFPRVSSWPLFGAFLALIAFRGAILTSAALGSEAFRSVAAGIFTPATIVWLPHAFLVLAGLVLVAWDALASSAHRKAGGEA